MKFSTNFSGHQTLEKVLQSHLHFTQWSMKIKLLSYAVETPHTEQEFEEFLFTIYKILCNYNLIDDRVRGLFAFLSTSDKL